MARGDVQGQEEVQGAGVSVRREARAPRPESPEGETSLPRPLGSAPTADAATWALSLETVMGSFVNGPCRGPVEISHVNL